VNTGASFALDHHCIHFAAADSAERFLRFGQAVAELGEFSGRRGRDERWRRTDFTEISQLGLGFRVKSTRQTGRRCSTGCRSAGAPAAELPDERRGRDNLAVARQDGLLIDVNHSSSQLP